MYSRDKDRIYLIGQPVDSEGKKKGDIISLEETEICKIKRTGISNDLYGTKPFEEQFETMFTASADPAVDVVLHFKNFGNIRAKVERLMKSRTTKPTLEVIPWDQVDEKEIKCFRYSETEGPFDVLCYRDRVSGLEDLEKYLRNFGSSVLVLEPPELKQRMTESVNHVMDAYREEGYLE